VKKITKATGTGHKLARFSFSILCCSSLGTE